MSVHRAVTEPDVAARLRLAVTRLARQLRQQTDSALTPSSMSALSTIEREGPMTLGALAEAERIAPPTVTKVVERLSDLGLVDRRPDAADRRVTRVELSTAGEAFLDEHRARKDAWLATRLASLDADDLDRLGDALPIIEAILEGRR